VDRTMGVLRSLFTAIGIWLAFVLVFTSIVGA
jgi:hypothetical protein